MPSHEYEYPWSVSRRGDTKRAAVYRDGAALQVVFLPAHGPGAEHTAFVYRSDGRPPTILHPDLPHLRWRESLADHWYRVGF